MSHDLSPTLPSPPWIAAGVLFAHQLRSLNQGTPIAPLFARLTAEGPVVRAPSGPAELARLRAEAPTWATCVDSWVTTADGARTEALVVEVGLGDRTEQVVLRYQGRPARFPDAAASPGARTLVAALLRSSARAEIRDPAVAALTGTAHTLALRVPGAARPSGDALRAAVGDEVLLEEVDDGFDLMLPGRSSRGVTLSFASGCAVEVRTGATADDLLLGVRVAAWLAERAGGAVVTDRGAEPPAALRARCDAGWAAAAEAAGLDFLGGEVGRADVEVPLPSRAAVLGATVRAALAQAPDPRAELRRRLVALADPSSAGVAAPLVLSMGGDRCQTWTGVPTLLDRRVPTTSLAGPGGAVRFVATARVLAALGAVTSWDDATVITPAVEGAAWDALVRSLPEQAPPAPLAAWTAEAVAAAPHVLAPLFLALVGAALHVARADGAVDEAERRALLGSILARARRGGPLQAALANGPSPVAAAFLALSAAPDLAPALPGLFDRASAALDPSLRAAWRDEVLAVARTVAEASGPRTWFVFGSRTSPAEREALALVERLLTPH